MVVVLAVVAVGTAVALVVVVTVGEVVVEEKAVEKNLPRRRPYQSKMPLNLPTEEKELVALEVEVGVEEVWRRVVESRPRVEMLTEP